MGGATAAAAGEATSSSSRVKGQVFEMPIVFGNVAQFLGKKTEDSSTHRWTLYVRGCGPYYNSFPMFVKKVVFKLHESFPNPTRTVESAPFELTEHGWGEFEVVVKIHFMDPLEKPITLYHQLKLYATEDTIQIGKKTIAYEQYDEIVFCDPTETMYHLLSSAQQKASAVRLNHQEAALCANPTTSSIPSSDSPPKKAGPASNAYVVKDYVAEEKKAFLVIKGSKALIRKEIEMFLRKYKELDEEATFLRIENAKMEEKLRVKALADS